MQRRGRSSLERNRSTPAGDERGAWMRGIALAFEVERFLIPAAGGAACTEHVVGSGWWIGNETSAGLEGETDAAHPLSLFPWQCHPEPAGAAAILPVQSRHAPRVQHFTPLRARRALHGRVFIASAACLSFSLRYARPPRHRRSRCHRCSRRSDSTATRCQCGQDARVPANTAWVVARWICWSPGRESVM